MPRVQLSGGAYEARSLSASAQRCLNLYAEPMPQGQGEPSPWAYYPTPGLKLLTTLPCPTVNGGGWRGIRQATTGGIYGVVQDRVYRIHNDWTWLQIGQITSWRKNPVSLMDNGLDLLIVDGSTNGWKITLADDTFAQISDPTGSFAGADKVDYLDTFFIFNKPNTPQFYWSLSMSSGFDSLALDFANKQSFSDLLQTLVVCRREIWLIGERTTEVWYDVGASDTGAGSSQFQEVGGVFIEHGTLAKYSVAGNDDAIYWLTHDRSGGGMVFEGAQYKTKKISTSAIDTEIGKYPRTDDAVGWFYNLRGHTCYVLTFPSADHTWCYDTTTGQWHEWAWIDANGEEHRHRGICSYAVNGKPLVGDWQNGNLYMLDQDVYTDAGMPIKRQRTYPHLLNDSNRVFYRRFRCDLETGNPR